ncbi:response regulator transcription factor, partial [Streptomyces sp. NPDC057909]|uniref:response regulator transcription factor n=1 Tax=Streptomyces sp. NPDC057909 TaxID=3346277 RepID=UPI0036EC0A6B
TNPHRHPRSMNRTNTLKSDGTTLTNDIEAPPRETEVLRLVAEGLSDPEVAARLLITEETVRTHVSRILAKPALRDRTQAVVTAYESGLDVPGSRG